MKVDGGENGAFELTGLETDTAYVLDVAQHSASSKRFVLRSDSDTYVLQRRSLRVRVFHRGHEIGGRGEGRYLSWNPFDDPMAPGIVHHVGGDVTTVDRGTCRRAFVWCNDFAPTVVDLEAVTVELVIEVEDGAVLEGRVVTQDGKPMQNVEVQVSANILGPDTVRLVDGYCLRSKRTDASGNFRIDGLPTDPQKLSVSVLEAPGWEPARPLEVTSFGEPVTFVMKKRG